MEQPDRLSRREQEVMDLLLQGKTNKAIAAALGISVRTVEFHLRNIYAKCQVSSRVELLVKLGNPAGRPKTENPVVSTVEKSVPPAENGGRRGSRALRAESFRNAASWVGRELEMKQLWNNRHILVGVLAALLAGFSWIALFRVIENMPPEEIKPWLAPLILVWSLIGVSVGLAAKRSGGSLWRTGLSTLLSAGLSPIAILPLMGFVVMPVAKLMEGIGLIDASTLSRDAATTLAIIAMLGIWLFLGIAGGIMLVFVSFKRPEHNRVQIPTS